MGISLTEKLRRMKAAGALTQAQQEAPANNPTPATKGTTAAGVRPSVQPSSQATTSSSAPSHRRKRDDLIAEVLAQRKSPAAAATEPTAPEQAPVVGSGRTQDQLIAGFKARVYQRSLAAAARHTAANTAPSSPAVAAASMTTAGDRGSQKSSPPKRKKLTPSPPVQLLDAELEGMDTEDDDDVLDSDEEEEDEELEDSRPRKQRKHQTRKAAAQQTQRKSPSQRRPASHIKKNANNTAVAAAINSLATEVQVDIDDGLALQPITTDITTPPDGNQIIFPPPPAPYRLRFDENGEEIPLNSSEEAYLDLAVPGSIAKHLRPYQRTGIKFLLQNYARGRGCLIADDMGLGKSLQTIAFLSAILGKTGDSRVDVSYPQLPQFERLKEEATLVLKNGKEKINLKDDFYAPDYSYGAPALIVCPPTLIDHWGEEFNKWGTFRVTKLHSNCVDTGVAALIRGTSEVGVTSYDTIRNNSDKFARVPWHVVVFDEAHKLKNPKAGLTIACNRLPTRLRFALSGTPMPNDYQELYHLINFIAPGALGNSSEDFSAKYAKKIKHGLRSDATEVQIAEGTIAQEELAVVLRPLIIRRTKEIIAHQLPKKKDNIVLVTLSPLQKRAYLRALNLPDVKNLLLKARDECPCGSGKMMYKCNAEECPGYFRLTYEQGGVLYPHFHFCECDNVFDPVSNPTGCKHHKPDGCWRKTMYGLQRMCPFCLTLPLMTILRKISFHLDLVKANPDDEETDPIKYKWDKEIAETIFGTDSDALGGPIQSSRHIEMTADITQSSGKLAALKGLLTKWAADARGSGGLPHKVLIFSNSVRMLKIVSKMSDNAGWTYKYLTGETPMQERQALVNDFNGPNSTDFLFIVSTGSGGVGLNLTVANKVVILDPSYSPAADLQAMDRAFRIGQKRNVDVYRLVAAGTIEERIYMRQMSKQQHTNVAVDGIGQQKRLFTGVKGDISQKGELWGYENMLGSLLLDEVAERVQVMDVIETAERNDGGAGPSSRSGVDTNNTVTGAYTVEEVPEEVTAELAAAAAGSAGSGGGDAEDGFDPGLEAALLEEEAKEEDDEEEDEVLYSLPGVQGIVNHSRAMEPSKKEAALRKEAVAHKNAARAAAEQEQNSALAASSVAVPASVVECLAAWKGRSVRDMASLILGMTEKERTALRYEYIESTPKEGLFPSNVSLV